MGYLFSKHSKGTRLMGYLSSNHSRGTRLMGYLSSNHSKGTHLMGYLSVTAEELVKPKQTEFSHRRVGNLDIIMRSNFELELISGF